MGKDDLFRSRLGMDALAAKIVLFKHALWDLLLMYVW